jgi:hypothetical protein
MKLGALGEMLVLPLMLAAWPRGEVGPAGVASAAGDLAFALLFLDVPRRPRSPSRRVRDRPMLRATQNGLEWRLLTEDWHPETT